ncbi:MULTISPECIES: hypothetical protein [Sphingomonas]|uniref:hypothetical protein n=1 Tax=Sphingomonas TaxID=13687 RepID=UPI0013B3BF1B|nr:MULTISPECIES: hypothetical protein [Sphingomonas]
MKANYLFIVFLLLTVVTAFIRGKNTEQVGITIYLVGCLLTVLAASPGATRFTGEETGILLVDLTTFAAFFVLALNANRFWPIWVTALLAIPLFGHLARMLAPDILPWAYAAILSMWSYPILLIILLASLKRRASISHGPF